MDMSSMKSPAVVTPGPKKPKSEYEDSAIEQAANSVSLYYADFNLRDALRIGAEKGWGYTEREAYMQKKDDEIFEMQSSELGRKTLTELSAGLSEINSIFSGAFLQTASQGEIDRVQHKYALKASTLATKNVSEAVNTYIYDNMQFTEKDAQDLHELEIRNNTASYVAMKGIATYALGPLAFIAFDPVAKFLTRYSDFYSDNDIMMKDKLKREKVERFKDQKASARLMEGADGVEPTKTEEFLRHADVVLESAALGASLTDNATFSEGFEGSYPKGLFDGAYRTGSTLDTSLNVIGSMAGMAAQFIYGGRAIKSSMAMLTPATNALLASRAGAALKVIPSKMAQTVIKVGGSKGEYIVGGVKTGFKYSKYALGSPSAKNMIPMMVVSGAADRYQETYGDQGMSYRYSMSQAATAATHEGLIGTAAFAAVGGTLGIISAKLDRAYVVGRGVLKTAPAGTGGRLLELGKKLAIAAPKSRVTSGLSVGGVYAAGNAMASDEPFSTKQFLITAGVVAGLEFLTPSSAHSMRRSVMGDLMKKYAKKSVVINEIPAKLAEDLASLDVRTYERAVRTTHDYLVLKDNMVKMDLAAMLTPTAAVSSLNKGVTIDINDQAFSPTGQRAGTNVSIEQLVDFYVASTGRLSPSRAETFLMGHYNHNTFGKYGSITRKAIYTKKVSGVDLINIETKWDNALANLHVNEVEAALNGSGEAGAIAREALGARVNQLFRNAFKAGDMTHTRNKSSMSVHALSALDTPEAKKVMIHMILSDYNQLAREALVFHQSPVYAARTAEIAPFSYMSAVNQAGKGVDTKIHPLFETFLAENEIITNFLFDSTVVGKNIEHGIASARKYEAYTFKLAGAMTERSQFNYAAIESALVDIRDEAKDAGVSIAEYYERTGGHEPGLPKSVQDYISGRISNEIKKPPFPDVYLGPDSAEKAQTLEKQLLEEGYDKWRKD